MASYADIIGGLTIFAKHAQNGMKAHSLSAEHDEIFAGTVKPDQLSEDEQKSLKDMGWMWSEQYESWRRFV